ncbi:hypothetical protein T12_1603 [Trichinella patagoniensis]|uniref:Uncharacterized protein n=1 Tax=Trichinella patagoniensis TaxID=990121 RepID=A0A0V0Z6G7_9BILA|nr:hypothetical protein T12_1603 [Trichinella patagoniensis]
MPVRTRRRRRGARFASLGPRAQTPRHGGTARGGGRQAPSSNQSRAYSLLPEVVRPNPLPSPTTNGRGSLPEQGMGLGTLSGRRCLKRCSAFAASCPRPPNAFLPALRTSGGRRHAANRLPMSSRGGLPPPSRPSLPGVLGERLARCWPICGARTRPKPARTPTGPSSFELPQPSRTSRSGRGRLMPPNMRTHRPHCQKGGARQPETYSSEAVTANLLLVIPPEKSADVPVLRPHSDLQVHLFDVGLQPYAKAAEG